MPLRADGYIWQLADFFMHSPSDALFVAQILCDGPQNGYVGLPLT
jgi:hypothetical protein